MIDPGGRLEVVAKAALVKADEELVSVRHHPVELTAQLQQRRALIGDVVNGGGHGLPWRKGVQVRAVVEEKQRPAQESHRVDIAESRHDRSPWPRVRLD